MQPDCRRQERGPVDHPGEMERGQDRAAQQPGQQPIPEYVRQKQAGHVRLGGEGIVQQEPAGQGLPGQGEVLVRVGGVDGRHGPEDTAGGVSGTRR